MNELTEIELISAYQAAANSKLKSRYSSELLKRNDRLIRKYSRIMRDRYEMYSDRMEWEDLYQECCIGYLEAIGKFDTTSAKPLSSYAYFWMWQKARRYFENHGRMIRHNYQSIDTKVADISASYTKMGNEIPKDAFDHLFKNALKRDEYFRFKSTSTGRSFSLDELEATKMNLIELDSPYGNPEEEQLEMDAKNPIIFVLKTFSYADAKVIAANAKIQLNQLGLTQESFPKKVAYPRIKGVDRITQLNDEFKQRLQLTSYTKDELMEVFTS